jgi:metal-responsive CopG/Arc/MetJ family transcriptional regulator
MQINDKEDYTRISIKIPEKLLAEFDEYARSKNYQRRDKAMIDLIKKELDKN